MHPKWRPGMRQRRSFTLRYEVSDLQKGGRPRRAGFPVLQRTLPVDRSGQMGIRGIPDSGSRRSSTARDRRGSRVKPSPCPTIHSFLRAPRRFCTEDLWGRLATCGRSSIGLFVGQPILAAAGFQPALFASRYVGFCRKRRSRQGSSVARANTISCTASEPVANAR
jgi:hypothetical protein